MTRALTAELLRHYLTYNAQTGLFTRLTSRLGPNQNSTKVGSRHSAGYLQVRIERTRYFVHRLAWLYVYGAWPAGQIDHINGDRSDNRISNLRDVSASGNRMNMTRPQARNRTGLLGVSTLPSGKFRARISNGGRQVLIGAFSTAEEASAAYLSAKQTIHQEIYQ